MRTSMLATDGYKFSMAEAGWPLRDETFHAVLRRGGLQVLPFDVTLAPDVEWMPCSLPLMVAETSETFALLPKDRPSWPPDTVESFTSSSTLFSPWRPASSPCTSLLSLIQTLAFVAERSSAVALLVSFELTMRSSRLMPPLTIGSVEVSVLSLMVILQFTPATIGVSLPSYFLPEIVIVSFGRHVTGNDTNLRPSAEIAPIALESERRLLEALDTRERAQFDVLIDRLLAAAKRL